MSSSIILKTLIDSFTFKDIKLELIKLYPPQKKCIEGYEDVLSQLQDIKPKKSKLKLVIDTRKDEDDDEAWINVSGDDGKQIWAIEFTPWAEWLGMKIDHRTLNLFSKIDIVCHSLWEMTYMGWDEKTISGEIMELQKRVSDVKSGKAKLLSCDELFNDKLK